MARKNVGQLAVGQLVTVDGRPGDFRIVKFPSRRLAIVEPLVKTDMDSAPVTVELRSVHSTERL